MIIQVTIAIPVNRLFDDLAPIETNSIEPGSRVLVPFGKHKKEKMGLPFALRGNAKKSGQHGNVC